MACARFPVGFLEVSVNGALVHSKKGGDGYVDSQAKTDKMCVTLYKACLRRARDIHCVSGCGEVPGIPWWLGL
jgi:hypothetical protein